MEDFTQLLEDSLLEEFDHVTIRKGRAYFAQGAVRELIVDDSTLTATVTGMRPHPYCVRIHVDADAGLPDAMDGSCSCPRSVLCEHMAAAIIAFVRQTHVQPAHRGSARCQGAAPATGREHALAELSRLAEMTAGARESTVRIDQATGTPYPFWASTYLSPPPVPRPGPDRWRLIFVVGLAPTVGSGPQSPFRTESPALFRAVQYITKTGKLGRVEKYRPGCVTEPVDDEASHLSAHIQLSGGAAPLLVHWDQLVRHPEIALFAGDGEGRPLSRVPYAVRRIRKIVISPVPEIGPFEGRTEVALRLRVKLLLEGEDGDTPTADLRWSLTGEGRTILSLGFAVLAWTDAEPRYLALVADLMDQKPLVNPGELHALHARFKADQPAGISIEVPFGAVRMVSNKPATRLVIGRDHWSGDLGVAVHFSYGKEGVSDNDVYVLPIPDGETERRAIRALRELFEDGAPTNGVTPHSESAASALFRLATSVEEFLRLFGEELLSRGIDLYLDGPLTKIERHSDPIRITVQSGIDWFGLKAHADVELDLRSIGSEDALFAAGFIRSRGRLLYIGRDETAKLKEILALLDPDSPDARVNARDLDAVYRLGQILDSLPPDFERFMAVARALAHSSQPPELPVPAGFTATLRGYQHLGYSWMGFLADNGLNGCLADDMGLGKTVQTLALLARRKEQKATGPSLVVAPVSTLQNWCREAARFAPDLRVLVHHGPARARAADPLTASDLVVVSYATLRMDAQLLQSIPFDVVVLDEAQSVKNPLSQSFAVVKGLQGRHRFTLTGTPLENSVVDLWSQLDFLEPGLLGSLPRFRKDYARGGDGTRVQRLRRVIRPFILRRTKEVVESSLPSKEETTLYAEMGGRQAAAYQAIRKRYRVLIAGALKIKGIAGSGALIFEGLLRLRQAACFPAHADSAYGGVPSCKMEVLRDLVDEVLGGGHRLLIFSQFVQTLDEIKREMEARKTAYAYLDGSTRNRQGVIDDFQRDDGPPIFLLSLKAGGVGINLTAADYVVIFDPWWNPAVESQAVDRTHRIGQDKAVFVYRIVTRESIEEQVVELQNRKRSLARDLIDQDPKSLLSLSEEEILGLFDDRRER